MMSRFHLIPLLLSVAPALLVAPAVFAAGEAAAALPLMPMPREITREAGALKIDSTFRIAVTGYSDARLESAVKRFIERVARQTGIPLQPSDNKPALLIECHTRAAQYPALGEDESYQLDVSPSAARLSASTVTGILRGFETFAQLIGPGPNGFEVPAIHIEDRPRFPWRGFMLDVSRHWMPVAVVERNLDAMAAVKLNVFHWHLSDDQGFRVESKRYPKLHQKGSDGNFYTQAEVREIVAYARDRGIRVVPEFDMPGHTTAWFVGYPGLASAPGPYAIERKWGVFQPTMDPTREETYTFLDGFLAEMAALFPDPYFHIGGDEVDETQWKRSIAIQTFAHAHGLSTSHDLEIYFIQRVEKLLRKHGKTMVGWDEVLSPGLRPETIIQSWRGPSSLAEAAAKGYRSLLSFGYYLDHFDPASKLYANDPPGEHTLGGEACMWTEYTSAETVDSRIWPRLAAIAERFWSPRDITNVDSMYGRLEAVSRWLEWSGIKHRDNELLLERLAGGRPTAPLHILTDASEALGIDGRREARHYTSLMPLNRFVDAVPPESELVLRVEREIGAATVRERFASTLEQWASVETRLRPLVENNALLAEIAPLATNLTATANIGLRALEFLENGQAPPPGWIEQQNKVLDQLEKPVAEVRLAAVRPVRLLLSRLKPKTLAKSDVRSGNEPFRTGHRAQSGACFRTERESL